MNAASAEWPLVKRALESTQPRADVEALATRLGWVHRETLPADAAHGLEIIWDLAPQRLALHYVEDELVGQAYLALWGEGAEQAAAEIGQQLPCVDLAQALSRPRDDAALPGLLAVLGPAHYDAALMHALADLLQSEDAVVRVRTLTAIASLGWIELRPLVLAVSLSDREDFLRRRAAELLEAYRRVDAQGRV